jgi:hypothetical protein
VWCESSAQAKKKVRHSKTSHLQGCPTFNSFLSFPLHGCPTTINLQAICARVSNSVAIKSSFKQLVTD